MERTAHVAPAWFVSHGGGPCFFMDGGLRHLDRHSPAAQWFRTAHRFVKHTPRAIIVVSAHWETRRVSISAKPAPSLLFDYYGFPPHTYELTYPARCDTALAHRIHAILTEHGIEAELDEERDWDHGVFVPLKLIYPDAHIPLVQISLNASLSPTLHYRIGQLLASLRTEGVMVLGSGQATHNMRLLMTLNDGAPPPNVDEFLAWLTRAVAEPSAAVRERLLLAWENAPHGREMHPREEHLMPLLVVAGAADSSVLGAKCVQDEVHSAFALHSYLFED